eukprot:11215561-Lingulodinium_polyedra.AAC.1
MSLCNMFAVSVKMCAARAGAPGLALHCAFRALCMERAGCRKQPQNDATRTLRGRNNAERAERRAQLTPTRARER